MEAGYLMDGGDFRATVARALDGVSLRRNWLEHRLQQFYNGLAYLF